MRRDKKYLCTCLDNNLPVPHPRVLLPASLWRVPCLRQSTLTKSDYPIACSVVFELIQLLSICRHIIKGISPVHLFLSCQKDAFLV